jgi:hypothetical protein
LKETFTVPKQKSNDDEMFWSQDDIAKARREMMEDSDIPRDDPDEDEPYMTRSECIRRGIKPTKSKREKK